MSKPSPTLFGVIVCDSEAKWGGPEGIAKRVAKLFGTKEGQWKTYEAERGEFPSEEELKTFEGFYITGSNHSVNDETLPWIKQLELFVQRAHALKKPKVFGTCFGHQAISKALGGKVGKNPSKGFVCGNEEIELCESNNSKFLNDLRRISEKSPFRILKDDIQSNLRMCGKYLFAGPANKPYHCLLHEVSVLLLRNLIWRRVQERR